jgi:MOSC domain-containing protein YiiM
MTPFAVAVGELRVGRALPFGPNGEPSAIDKRTVLGAVRVTKVGLAGDEQGDPRHHGGPEKALHHYPADHYTGWSSEVADVSADRWSIGAFGENLSTRGLVEPDVFVGDVFRLGDALVQISQARQPCWKLNIRFGRADMSRRVQASGRTGWYYRVLEAGDAAPGDELRLVDRPCPDWPLPRLLHHLYVDPLDRSGLEAMAALPLLAESWREIAARRLASGRIEEWSRRLDTPRASRLG